MCKRMYAPEESQRRPGMWQPVASTCPGEAMKIHAAPSTRTAARTAAAQSVADSPQGLAPPFCFMGGSPSDGQALRGNTSLLLGQDGLHQMRFRTHNFSNWGLNSSYQGMFLPSEGDLVGTGKRVWKRFRERGKSSVTDVLVCVCMHVCLCVCVCVCVCVYACMYIGWSEKSLSEMVYLVCVVCHCDTYCTCL